MAQVSHFFMYGNKASYFSFYTSIKKHCIFICKQSPQELSPHKNKDAPIPVNSPITGLENNNLCDSANSLIEAAFFVLVALGTFVYPPLPLSCMLDMVFPGGGAK